MVRGHLISALCLSLVLVVSGCSRGLRPPTSTPEALPEHVAAQPQPAYLQVVQDFVGALQRAEPQKAWELLTEKAQHTFTVEQFAADTAQIRPADYKVVVQAATPQAAFVLVAFEGGEQLPTPGMGLLLRSVGETWRVSFFMPQAPDEVKADDLALQKTGEREFTLTWTGAQGSPQSLIITEF